MQQKTMKIFYGILCVAGTVFPYWQLVTWIYEHGLDISALLKEAVSTRIGAFAWLDVIFSAIVLFGFMMYEGQQLRMKHIWLPVVGTLTVGVSLGLPLFLLFREIHLEQAGDETNVERRES